MINMKDSAEVLAGFKLKLGAKPKIEASKDTKLEIKQEPKVISPDSEAAVVISTATKSMPYDRKVTSLEGLKCIDHTSPT